ncbi:MAG: MBL fold metallo-hydrolase [Gemmatimonadaceae bacterium]|nr:MBL fold metallo-hydrolase [Gemmatimonadaceae bacterium]
MKIEFAGAAREVTGSCHILRVGGKTVLLDCGMFQGRRSETRAKNLELPLPVEQIDAVVLSHAHIDHAGRLPLLVSRGYRGPIHCTAATRDLSAVMLADSAHIQEKDAEFLARRGKEAAAPLYTMRDAARTAELMIGLPYDTAFDVVPGVRATFSDAGHILGSASVALDCVESGTSRRIVFSGDVGRAGLPIIRDPNPPVGADVVLLESTYGNRDHLPVEGARDALATIIRETAARGGRILVPAFSVGRTQELVYDLHVLAREGKIPGIPIIVDSPLAIDATTVFAMHPEVFDQSENLIQKVNDLFHFPLLRYTREAHESKALNEHHGPMIIIAASGMMEAGRILHHLAHGAADPRNTILIVGFQAEHTLGRRIVDRAPLIKVFGHEIPLRAQVSVLGGYSAHGDRTELHAWLDAVRGPTAGAKSPPVYLVHGEPAAQDAFAAQLRGAGYSHVTTPERHAVVTI